MSVRRVIFDLPRSTSVPTVLIALDRFLAEPGMSGTWPEWNKIIGCPPSDLADHPWSNLGATQDEHVDHEVSPAVDKGKGKEKEKEVEREVGGGEGEGEADTAAGTVEDGGEGQHAGGPSKPTPRGRNQSRRHSQSCGHSQSRRPRKRVKSAAIVRDSDEEDESIPQPTPCHNSRYDIYNPPDTHQCVDDEARCMVCAQRGLPSAIKEVGRACYQCNRTKHGCSLVVKQRCSRSRSQAPTTTARRSPTPGPSLQPTRTNPPRSTRKRKMHSPSVRPSSTERGRQSELFYISFPFYSYSK